MDIKTELRRIYNDTNRCIISPTEPSISFLIRDKADFLLFNSMNVVYTLVNENEIKYSGINALDFLDTVLGGFGDLNEKELFLVYLGRYIDTTTKTFEFVKTLPMAEAPFKARASDSGYDLTLVRLDKVVGGVYFYDTGIALNSIPYGIYFDLIGRSSISKSGYLLANNMGVIDRSYRGNIIVPLIKINKDAPDLQMPCRLVQIIPRQIVHLIPKQVQSIDTTARMYGGFGSTN
jgi:dUTPase